VEATLKLQREHLKSMEVKPEAVADWDAYIEVPAPSETPHQCLHVYQHHFAKVTRTIRGRSWY
jgi:hypothetical protein